MILRLTSVLADLLHKKRKVDLVQLTDLIIVKKHVSQIAQNDFPYIGLL
jgi:hypothetical protein